VKNSLLLFCFSFLAGFLCILSSSVASASPITFSATNGSLSASATFDVSGTGLVVTLTNTSTSDVLAPADILAAVFFTLADDLTLYPESAILGQGSTVLFSYPDGSGNVGGEWAYKNGLTGAPLGANQGIAAAGFGLFGPGDRFSDTNLAGPPSGSVGGLDYGITSAGDDPTTGNSPVTGGNALIQEQVIFTFNGIPSDFNSSSGVSNV
jgi:hypothetical protein